MVFRRVNSNGHHGRSRNGSATATRTASGVLVAPRPLVPEVREKTPTTPAAPQATAPAPAVADAPSLMQRLVELVSERTGYPAEMLLPDADLEAELGVDSIKRVEIAGSIVRTLTWPAGVSPDLERLTGSRTLRQVVDQLKSMLESSPVSAHAGPGGPSPFDEGRARWPSAGTWSGQLPRPPFRAGLSRAGRGCHRRPVRRVADRLATRLIARELRSIRVVLV